MPIKKFFPYLILGFVLYAYLNMPILGVALIGIVIAVVSYQKSEQEEAAAAVAQVNNMGGNNEDE